MKLLEPDSRFLKFLEEIWTLTEFWSFLNIAMECTSKNNDFGLLVRFFRLPMGAEHSRTSPRTPARTPADTSAEHLF